MSTGKLIVLSAPSGTGKTSICKKLLENNSNFQFEIIENLSKENLIKKLPDYDAITLRTTKLDSEIINSCKFKFKSSY